MAKQNKVTDIQTGSKAASNPMFKLGNVNMAALAVFCLAFFFMPIPYSMIIIWMMNW